MQRREFLLLAGTTGMVSGCLAEDQNLENNAEQNEDPDDQDDTADIETSTPEKSGFELIEINHPKKVSIGQFWKWSATIKNHSEDTEVFKSNILIYHGDGEWENFNEINFTIPSGDERTFESPESQLSDPAIARYKIEQFNQTFEVTPNIEELSFGETFQTENNLNLTVDEIGLFDTIEYTTERDEKKVSEADEGMTFGSFTVRIENNSTNIKDVPPPNDFFIWGVENGSPIKGQGGRYQWSRAFENEYIGGEIEPDSTIVGKVGFDISSAISTGDITISLVGDGFGIRWGESPPHSPFYDNPARKISP